MTLAQSLTTAPTTQQADNAPAWYRFLEDPKNFLILGVGIVFLILFNGGKGRRGEEKARQEQLKQLKRGDRIQTIGGIQGTVVTVEENRIAVKVDESSNVKMWFVRNAIAKVIESGGDGKSDK